MRERYRADDQGFIVQDSKGRMVRLEVPEDCMREYAGLSEAERLVVLGKRLALAELASPAAGALLEAAFEEADCLSRPLRIYYNIEEACDLNCRFCGPREQEHAPSRSTADSQVRRERFILEEIARAGAFQVQLTGGEVFLRAERLFDTLELCRELGLAVLLGTNGFWSRIKDKQAFVEQLASYDHIIEVKVSIDGTEAFHDEVRGRKGSYQAALETVEALTAADVPTRINATVFRDSCQPEFIEHLAALAKRLDTSLQVVPERACGRSLGRSAEELPTKTSLLAYTLRATELRKQQQIPLSFNFDILGGGRTLPVYDRARPFSCGAGLWGVAITHEGEIFPCGFAIETGSRSFSVGKLEHAGDLLNLWLNSAELKAWRRAEKCAQCQGCAFYGTKCWGGCKVQAVQMTGSLSGLDPYCFSEELPPPLVC